MIQQQSSYRSWWSSYGYSSDVYPFFHVFEMKMMKWQSCCISSVLSTTTGEAEDGLRSYQSHTEERVWRRSHQRWNVWYNRGLWNTSIHKRTIHPSTHSESKSIHPSVHPSVCLSNLWRIVLLFWKRFLCCLFCFSGRRTTCASRGTCGTWPPVLHLHPSH